MRSTRWCFTGVLVAMVVVLPAPSPEGTPIAHADTQPGSGFASYRMWASARALSVSEDNNRAAAHPQAEAEVPEAYSSLGSTGGSYGLASIAWPGALAGNLGTLLIVLSDGEVPDEAAALNDPIRAEARNNTGTTTNQTYPGMTLTATSHPDTSSASARLTGAQAPGSVSVGSTSAASSTRLVGVASARATATGSLHNLDLAGVVKIASVESSASVVSDAVKATGSGSTTVSGATVAGVPITIDETGVRASTTREALPGLAQQTVNTALAQLGMSVRLVGPTSTAKAGTIEYVAASLLFTWMPPPPPGRADTRETIILAVGGASAAVDAAPGSSGPQGPLTPAEPYPQPPPAGQPASQAGAPQNPSIAGPSQLPSVGDPGDAPVVAPLTTAAAQLPAQPSPLGVAWLLAGTALAAVLGLAFLRRLPTSFAASTASNCPWEVSA